MREQEDVDNGGKSGKKGTMMSKSMHYYKEDGEGEAEGGGSGNGNGEKEVQAAVEPQTCKGRRPSSSKSTPWPTSFQAPESKRKRRVASYKMYHVERKLKTSLSHSLHWFKSHIPYNCTW
ncbi:hypothetical protein L7F22_036305 [Adiantum nelumboides]|nr:hypothetical protein [Adiantum nelumboides]